MLYPCVSGRCSRARVRREFARQGMRIDARPTRCSPCCAETRKGRACRTNRALWSRIRIDSIREKMRRAISRNWGLRRRRRHWRANSMKAPDRFARTSAGVRCTGRRIWIVTSRRKCPHHGNRPASLGGRRCYHTNDPGRAPATCGDTRAANAAPECVQTKSIWLPQALASRRRRSSKTPSRLAL